MRVLHANGPVENTHSVVGQSGLTSPVSAGGSRIVVVSSNANDTSGGTGVRELTLSGFNALEFVQESVTMNGTANVTTTATFTEIVNVSISDSGANGIDGDITITNGSNTISKIKSDYGKVNDAFVYLDRSHRLHSICIYGDSTDSNTIYEISIVINSGKNDTVISTIYWDTDKDTHSYPLGGIVVNGSTTMYVRAKNLKHSGPDNVSVKLFYEVFDSRLAIDDETSLPVEATGSQTLRPFGLRSSHGGGGGGY